VAKKALPSHKFESLSKDHDRDGFDCGVHELNDFLKRMARQQALKGVNRTFVAVDEAAPEKILGYYSLSAGSIGFESLPPQVSKKLPRYPVPVVRIGRLAVDRSTQGLGMGGLLIAHALEAAIKVSDTIGVMAVVVDAKDEKAKQFYLHFEFIPFQDAPLSLFLPIETVIAAQG
jgi:GNAT superfamily N-acetyltransferase